MDVYTIALGGTVSALAFGLQWVQMWRNRPRMYIGFVRITARVLFTLTLMWSCIAPTITLGIRDEPLTQRQRETMVVIAAVALTHALLFMAESRRRYFDDDWFELRQSFLIDIDEGLRLPWWKALQSLLTKPAKFIWRNRPHVSNSFGRNE